MEEKILTGFEWFEEGQLQFTRGEHEKSVDAFTHAIHVGWRPAVAHLSRGVANIMAKHPDKAYEDFTEAVSHDEQNARAFYCRGVALMLAHRYVRAAQDFTRVLAIDPDYGFALLGRGVCHARMGKYDEAAVEVKKAMIIAETDDQDFSDYMGIWRNHLEETLGVLRRHSDLSEQDILKLKYFFE